MDFRDLERGLRTFEVEVRYRSGGPSSLHSVKLKPNETFKKIKRHITESLDIQGKLTYRETNLDDYASKRLAEIYFEGEKFYLVADKKPRELKHSVELKLPSVDGKEERTESIKIARTTTVGNLKHKIQDEFAIPVEELAIHNIPSQQKECHQETNVMRLSKVLEVRLVSSPAKKAQPARASIVRGTPYDTRQSAHVSKRKGYDGGGIHPKTFTKFKEKEKLGREGRESEGKKSTHNFTLILYLQQK